MSKTVEVAEFVVSREIEYSPKELQGLQAILHRFKNRGAGKEKQAEIDRRLKKWLASSPPDRLSPEEIESYTNGQPWEVWERHVADRREVYQGRDFEKTFQGLLFPLIRRVIKDDPSVGSILSIGCRYAYDLNILSKEYPNLKVSGVDLPIWIHRMNEEFPHIEIHQGYALDLLNSGQVHGDIATMISTACCFKPAELDAYMQALARQSKYVVLNELIDHLPNGHLPNTAKLTTSIPNIYSGAYPGLPPHFAHNYKAAAERAGFKVLHHRMYMPEWTDVYRIEMVAKAPG